MDAELDDAELVARCRRGEARGWNALVLRYKRLVFAIPRRAGLDEHHAADVFQAVFATLHRHLARIDDPSRLHAWIVTTAKRETLRVLREGRRSFASTGDADDDAIESIPDPAPRPTRDWSSWRRTTVCASRSIAWTTVAASCWARSTSTTTPRPMPSSHAAWAAPRAASGRPGRGAWPS